MGPEGRIPTPLDLASYYVENLKYGPLEGSIEKVSPSRHALAFQALLRRAGIYSMTGEDLLQAGRYYGESCAHQLGISETAGRSIFYDGLMHGIAFAAGLEGKHRNPKPAP